MKNSRTHSEKHWGADRWGLVLAVVLAAGVFSVLFASIARAQPGNPERPELPELELTACPDLADIDAEDDVVHFPRTTSDCMLARLRLLPEAMRWIDGLEDRIERDDVRIELRDREVALAAQQAEVATENLETALRRAREAEESRDAWHRSPILWFIVGAVVTAGVVALAAYAINAASSVGITVSP